jgi:hypothetical protein
MIVSHSSSTSACHRGTGPIGLVCGSDLRGPRGAPQVPPLRCASVGMTRGRAVFPGRVVANRQLVFISLDVPTAHDCSGRDDKGTGVTSRKGGDLDGRSLGPNAATSPTPLGEPG